MVRCCAKPSVAFYGAAARCRDPARPAQCRRPADDRALSFRFSPASVRGRIRLPIGIAPGTRPFPMNQTRSLLLVAWLTVAALLWMAWDKEHATPASPATAPAASTSSAAPSPGSVPSVPDASQPAAPSPVVAATPANVSTQLLSVTTDVLRITLDGGALHSADVLRYPVSDAPGSAPIRLFADDPANFFEAQSGWVSSTGAAPSHEGAFLPATDQRAFVLAPGAQSLQVPFIWRGPNGVTIHRTYTFRRGDYVVGVRDEVDNQSATPWQGFVYRQLVRVPPQVTSGMMHPESYSFHGAAWYSDKDALEKRKFANYGEDPPLSKQVVGGWIGMLQHHFFTAWIPGDKDTSTLSTAMLAHGQTLIRELGPSVSV